MRPTWLLLLVPIAHACDCTTSRPCPSLGRPGSPVFLGTVISVEVVDRHAGFLSSVKVLLTVEDSFGGLAPGAREVKVWTGTARRNCGVPFAAGKTYLVDTFTGDDGLLHASSCGFSRALEFAPGILQTLRRQRNGSATPALAGQISQLVYTVECTDELPRKPEPNILVRLISKERTFETRTDAAGAYSFLDVPPGDYDVVPIVPPGLEVLGIGSPDHDPSRFRYSGACALRDILLMPTGSIQGTLSDSEGLRVRGAEAYLVPAGEPLPTHFDGSRTARSNDEGSFQFEYLPPGRYQLLVNPHDVNTPSFPYARTFHPGVITVYAGEPVFNADIHLKQQFTPRRIEVEVNWANGRAIHESIHLSVEAQGAPDLLESVSRDQEHPSRFTVLILPAERCSIAAHVVCGTDPDLSASPVAISPGDNQTHLNLTIPATGCAATQH